MEIRYVEMKVAFIAFLATTLLLLGSGEGYPVGVSAEPGGLLIQYIKPGELYDLEARSGLRLKISNRSSEQRTYRISVAQPQQLGIEKWIEGYVPIPQPDWFSLEPAEIEIAPQSTGYARMFINIPADSRYFNQHWVVALAIQSVPKGGEVLTLALRPVYYLETKSREDVSARTGELLGIGPTVLTCPRTSPGKEQARIPCGEVQIHNGDSRPHAYSISAEVPNVMASGQKVSPSPGFSWLENPASVVTTENHLTLKPGQSWTIGVRLLTARDKVLPPQNRECLLWVKPDKGSAGFVRIQIK